MIGPLYRRFLAWRASRLWTRAAREPDLVRATELRTRALRFELAARPPRATGEGDPRAARPP